MSLRHRVLHFVQEAENVARVTVTAEALDEANLQTTTEELFAVADGLTHRRIELDMAEVRYLTSTSLGKLIALYKRLRDRGSSLVLTNVNSLVFEIFEVTKLNRILDVRRGSDAGPNWPASTPLAS